MDEPTADFHVPANKGREAMAYLTFIIDHYSDLPSTIAFLHSHRDGYPGGWHTDAPGYDNVASLNSLRLDYVQQHGYANLRCIHVPGCPDDLQPFRQPYDEERKWEHAMPEAWEYMFGNATEVPQAIGVPCCSQFAVSEMQVLSRPREDYIRYRNWLLETPLEDYDSGRVMEYLWHIIFRRDVLYCPELRACYCDQFGRCD